MKNLPEGWKMHELGDFIESLEGGVSVNSTEEPEHASTKRILKSSAVSNGQFFPEKSKAITKVDEARAKLNPKAGCLIISRMNTVDLVGQQGYVAEDQPNVFLPDRLWQASFYKDAAISAKWLSYYLTSERVRQLIINAASGTSGSMKNISKPSFLKIPVLTPPLPEQHRIAAILSACDRAIDTTAQLLAKQEVRFEALQQKLVQGTHRISKFSSEVWQEVRLGQLFRERSERGQVDLPLLSITAKQGLLYRDELEKRDTSNQDKSKYKVIRVGDIGYNTMRLWQGVATLADKEGIISPAYTVVVPNERIDAQFASYLFKTRDIIHLFWRYSQGLVDDTLNCKFPSFAQVKVLIPVSVEEQRALAHLLSTADQEIKLLRQQHALLQQQKKGLMQRLLTGQAFTH